MTKGSAQIPFSGAAQTRAEVNPNQKVAIRKSDFNHSTWVLIGILLIAVLTRFVGIGTKSYWYDEFCSLAESAAHGQDYSEIPHGVIIASPPDVTSLHHAKPVWKIWPSIGQDFYPPLYFILLRCWREVFGSTEAATRSLSALAGILGVLGIYDVGKLAHGRTAGLWVAAIFALAGPQVEFARDARPYTLVILFALCLIDAIIRIEKFGSSPRRLISLGAAALAMLLTHYVAIPVAFALGCYALIRMAKPAGWKAAAIILAAAIIFAATWVPFMLSQRPLAKSAESGFLSQGAWSKLYVIEHLAALPIDLLGPPVQKDIANTWPAIIIYILPLLLIRQNRFLLLWLFWLIGAAGLFAILDQTQRMHHLSYTRYILMCGPPVYLIFAGVLANQPSWLRHAVPAAALLYCALSLRASYAQWQWPDWRHATQIIESNTGPNDLLVFASDGKLDWFSGQYMSYAFYAKQKPRNVLLLVQPADSALMQQVRTFHNITIVNGTNRLPDVSLPGLRLVKARSMMPFFMIYFATSDPPITFSGAADASPRAAPSPRPVRSAAPGSR